MADLSQIKLPNGNVYNIKDARISSSDISNWNNSITVTMSNQQPSSPAAGDVWLVDFEEEETLFEQM